ncbi:hypothetical protein LUZ60_013898 [Juncus effusus]|nr:hypothetical protein LUZ60_013898 [Juncus effusus]
MSSLSRELVFLILQFLDEEKFKESVHRLEQESGFFFNIKYFEEKVLNGEWDEVEKYLSGFTKVDDNRYSMKIFFEIRKQKYLEALDKHDRGKAVEILVKDLKVFSTFNEDLYKEITQLLTLENFRENEQLSKYGDTKSARSIMLIELKKLIEANPLFREKLIFPTLKASRLRTLINQSLNWQHQLCKNPKQNPDIKTLFIDHMCSPSSGPRPGPASVPPQLASAVPKPGPAYAPLSSHGPFPPPQAAANPNALAGWMANAVASSAVQPAVIAAANTSIGLPPTQVPVLKHPRQMQDYQTAESEPLMKRLRPVPHGDEVTYPQVNNSPIPQVNLSLDDLPRFVACALAQGSNVTSMDFHPSHQTLLLVGSGNGDVSLWEIGIRERLATKSFKVWEMNSCSPQFQSAFPKEPSVSTTRVAWSPDGSLIGVAFTKNLIHLHAFQPPTELRQVLEVDAHVGQVNDIAFSSPNKQLCVITCGDDKLIKVWDLNGQRLFVFEGHDAPVYSVLPHHKETIQFIFSTSMDGKIKAWLYDLMGSRVDYDAPGHWCTTMLYSADGTRLFSCGTSKDGESFLVEWNESEGAIKRTYNGFRKKSTGVVQFDTAQNRFLAAGEDNQIKFWDFDNTNMLTSIDAEGSLPSSPRLRFNKDGNMLAVTTVEGGIKILANTEGMKLLRQFSGSRTLEAFRAHQQQYESSPIKVAGPPSVTTITPSISKVEILDRNSPARPSPILNGGAEPSNPKPKFEEAAEKSHSSEILNPQQCRVINMPETPDSGKKVGRLLYTNSGVSLLALTSNGVQRLWKWGRSEQNPTGRATASVVPQHWQPNSGNVMANDLSGAPPEEAIPCIALSKNDSYVMSACGGKVSLFNMMTFKVMTTFMPPPPASSYLAFHPQDNNIIAIGMDDSTIHIYNVRVDEVKTKMKGHSKRITGLAFSSALDILVSSGADAQLCVWNTDSWEKKKTVPIQLPPGKPAVGDTRVQFNSDQTRLLVVHETQLAIYDASKMERLFQWVPQDALSAPILYATYSCNSQLVYASFSDGNIAVFDSENLRLRCRIAPTAYMPNSNGQVYPCVLAAHPQEPTQFALGLTDGGVRVLEPLESDRKWGPPVSTENGLSISNGRQQQNAPQLALPSPATAGAQPSDQIQR